MPMPPVPVIPAAIEMVRVKMKSGRYVTKRKRLPPPGDKDTDRGLIKAIREGGSASGCIALLRVWCPGRLGAVIRLLRYSHLLRFRMSHEAHRDARLVFRAAAEGRPLELQKRLIWGKLAGGLSIRRRVGNSKSNSESDVMVTPLEAAEVGGHSECVVTLLRELRELEVMLRRREGAAEREAMARSGQAAFTKRKDSMTVSALRAATDVLSKTWTRG